MASVFIAIDKATTENGCLKVPKNIFLIVYCHYLDLKGSHKAGRIDHVRVGGQNGADMERVEMLMKVVIMHKHRSSDSYYHYSSTH